MTKILRVPNGIISLAESKAECPHCERKIPFDEIEEKWTNSSRCFMEMKCKCQRFIGITVDITGDFVACELEN